MRRELLQQFTLLPIVLLGLFASQALAGISGKISGVVLDADSGEPIEGATVRLIGTSVATETDFDGEYFIINIPSGKYDVAVSFIGYESYTTREVRVLADLTTPVDMELSGTTLDIGEEVVVMASNPIVRRDLTESKVIFTADRLKTLPNILTVQSVLRNYPGVVEDRNHNLHIRGGRNGQVSYYFDGFSIQDPFVSQAGLRVIPSALEELTLASGGFSAEYGEALSGIVNAVTREGTSIYHGGIRMYEGYTHPYNVKTGDWQSLQRIGNRSASFSFSGPIPGFDPKRYTFSTAGEYVNDPTSLPNNTTLSYTGTAKVVFQPTANTKFKANLTRHESAGETYDHRDHNNVSYDFNLDGLTDYERKAYLLGITGSHSVNKRMILSASVNRFSTYTKDAPGNLFNTYWDQWPGYSVDANGVYNGTIHEDNYRGSPDYTDELQSTGFTVGDDFVPRYRYRDASYNAFAVNQIFQLNKSNQIKSGAEYRRYDISYDSKQFYNSRPYGEKYDSKPTWASIFVQDKMEYDDFIINGGIRWDYRDPDIKYNATPLDTIAHYEQAQTTARISPRFGISFPIAEQSVMHFNFGTYYQSARFDYMYMNLQGDVSTGLPLLGNPELEPEETVSYELGLDHLVGDDLRIDVTAFFKNIKNLVTTRRAFMYAGNPVTRFTNDDYGSVKGFDFTIEKLQGSGPLSGSVSYSYMHANGNGSDPYEPYITYITSNADTLAPSREYPLDFDQRHNVTAAFSYRADANWRGSIFGVEVPSDWALTFVNFYGSGMPYTPTDATGNRLGERNEGRLPATWYVDMRINKDFRMVEAGYTLSLFMEVDNLLDRRNTINVYSRTGQPDDDGNYFGAGSLSLNQEKLDIYDFLYDHDPQNFSPPRTVRAGLELNF